MNLLCTINSRSNVGRLCFTNFRVHCRFIAGECSGCKFPVLHLKKVANQNQRPSLSSTGCLGDDRSSIKPVVEVTRITASSRSLFILSISMEERRTLWIGDSHIPHTGLHLCQSNLHKWLKNLCELL